MSRATTRRRAGLFAAGLIITRPSTTATPGQQRGRGLAARPVSAVVGNQGSVVALHCRNPRPTAWAGVGG